MKWVKRILLWIFNRHSNKENSGEDEAYGDLPHVLIQREGIELEEGREAYRNGH